MNHRNPTTPTRRQFMASGLVGLGGAALAQNASAGTTTQPLAASRRALGEGEFFMPRQLAVADDRHGSDPKRADAQTGVEVLASQLALRGLEASSETSGSYPIRLAIDAGLQRDAYSVEVKPNRTVIRGGNLSGLLAGCGEWLRAVDWSGACPVGRTLLLRRSPEIELRMQQIPGHFGNVFECMSRREMREYLTDQALAGSNGYADRYDMGEFVDPFHHHANRQDRPLSYAAELWAKKARHLLDARHLGLATCVTLNPNHVYLDQWSPLLDATPGPHMIGNLVCPSKPEARRLILKNHNDLFSFLAERGVTLDAIRPAPYDDGGCACRDCRPYLLTFLQLADRISTLGRDRWPAMETFISGWWLTDGDIESLRQWRLKNQADWLTTFLFSTGYTVKEMPDLQPKLDSIRYGTYIHAGYSGKPDDKYGRTGTHSAPRRLQRLVRQYPRVGCLRFMAYTEGVESHLNSFLTARLGYDPACDLRAETAGYCRWFFGTSEPDTASLVDLLFELESLDIAQADGWLGRLKELLPRINPPAGRSYLWEQLVLKTELMAIDARARAALKGVKKKNPADWPPEIAGLASEYEDRYDHLQRRVWGTGVRRHILQDSFCVPGWLTRYWQAHDPDRRPLLRRNSAATSSARNL